MPRSYRLYLSHIQRAIQRINALIEPLDEATFRSGALPTDGVLFNLMTIGEATKNIPQTIRDLAPEVRWPEIARFRDFAIHHYFSLDMEQVWKIVKADLPVLEQQIISLLANIGDPENGEK